MLRTILMHMKENMQYLRYAKYVKCNYANVQVFKYTKYARYANMQIYVQFFFTGPPLKTTKCQIT